MISRMVSHRSFPYVMAFLMPFIICVVICIGNGVYPFGDNCILHIDMYHQYCPFFTEFLHKLRTGGSLQYSWNLGLGSDLFPCMPIIWRVRLIFDRALPETLCDRVYDDTGAGKDCPVRTDFFLIFKISFSSDWKRLKTP